MDRCRPAAASSENSSAEWEYRLAALVPPCSPVCFGVYMTQPPPNGDLDCGPGGSSDTRRCRKVPQQPELRRQSWLASARDRVKVPARGQQADPTPARTPANIGA